MINWTYKIHGFYSRRHNCAIEGFKKKSHNAGPWQGLCSVPLSFTGFTSSSPPNQHTFKLLAGLQPSSAILHLLNKDSGGPFFIRRISYRFGLFAFPLRQVIIATFSMWNWCIPVGPSNQKFISSLYRPPWKLICKVLNSDLISHNTDNEVNAGYVPSNWIYASCKG